MLFIIGPADDCKKKKWPRGCLADIRLESRVPLLQEPKPRVTCDVWEIEFCTTTLFLLSKQQSYLGGFGTGGVQSLIQRGLHVRVCSFY